MGPLSTQDNRVTSVAVALNPRSAPASVALAADSAEQLPGDLLDHLARHSALNRTDAARLVREVLAYFNETLEGFVERRHSELQRQGLANPAIFQQIAAELRWWRLSAPPLSERQIRRIVYG